MAIKPPQRMKPCRHCERSAAVQSFRYMDYFTSFAMTVVFHVNRRRVFLVAPARQGVWPASSYWGTRNRQPATHPTSLAALVNRMTVAGHCLWLIPNSPKSGPHQCRRLHGPGVAAEWGAPRFLVPQYEGGAPFGCCAARARHSGPTLSATSTKRRTQNQQQSLGGL